MHWPLFHSFILTSYYWNKFHTPLYPPATKNFLKLKMELLINNVDTFLKSIFLCNWCWDILISFSFYLISLMWHDIENIQRKRKCKWDIVSFTLRYWWDIRITLGGSIVLVNVNIPSNNNNCGSHNFCWKAFYNGEGPVSILL